MPSNNDGRVIINIDSNASKAQREFEALDVTTSKYNQTLKNTQNTANSSKSALSSYGNQLKANKTSASGLSGALGTLGGSLGSLGTLASGAAAGFALLKLKDYGQYALQTAASFEQLAISFRVMTGSAQTGQALTDAIIELGAKTPMTAQQLSRAAQLLLSFGESAENIIPDLKLLGDITGGEANRFSQLALVFAQVGANGKLMGQDLLQMVNAGFNPLQIMSQTTGKSMGELRKEMEEGRISFQMVAQAMRDAASEGGRYFGLMEQQSQSLNGRLSTLGDTWEQVAKSIGDIFAPAAKAAVNALISLGEATQKSIEWLKSEQSTLKGLKQSWLEYWASKRKDKSTLVFTVEPYLNERRTQKQVQSALSKSGANTGFNATVLSSSASSTSSVTKQKDAYEKLQQAVQNARREVELNAITYGTSSTQVQNAFTKYRNLNTQLSEINKLFEENTKKAKENGGAYADLQEKISETRNQLLNMAVSGQGDTAQFTMLKNTLKQYELQAQQANTAVTNSVGLSWKNISNTISSQLSYALTTPLQEGENAFERLGNVALNVISQIGQSLISQVLNNAIEKIAARGTDGVMTGAAAAVTQTAQGYASMAASTNLAASGISKIASSQTAATAALTSSAATVAGAAATYKTAAVSAGQLASSITQAAISQAAYSAALVPIAGAALAPVAALATGTSIAAANVVASAGMLASRITAFKDGGVVNSPTLFPMSGNRTGLMGERGAEAIMPLKRTPSGQLGVQAQTSPATVNVYNQSDSRIETVQRPDGDTDIFIRRVNNALRSERTQAGFGAALQRNQSRGVQAS